MKLLTSITLNKSSANRWSYIYSPLEKDDILILLFPMKEG